MGLAFFMIPIVAILSKHQQKMAEIIHGRGRREDVDALRDEVSQLRSQVQQMAIERSSAAHSETTEALTTRLK